MSYVEDELEKRRQEVDEQDTAKLIISGLTGFLIVALIAIIALVTYVINFGQSLSTDKSEWGVFGDYLGGILNPAVGLITVYLVLINVIIQRKELKNSVREMKNSNKALSLQNSAIAEQSFQTTFFNWINTYNNIVSNTEWTGPDGGPPHRGHSALSNMYQYVLIKSVIKLRLLDVMRMSQYEQLLQDPTELDEKTAALAEQTILKTWNALKISREDYFEGGFRSLTGVIFWVADQPLNTVSGAKKIECMRIIESQTTNAEKAFLLYEYWTMSAKQKSVLNNYGLLLRLTDSNDPYAKFMLGRPRIS